MLNNTKGMLIKEKAEKELDKSNKAERLDFDKEDQKNLIGPVTIKDENGE